MTAGHPRGERSSDPATGSQLRGRAAEVRMLGDRLDQLERGRGGVVVIRGDAGIGKSALLTQAEALARDRGARVFHGASAPSDQMVPLAALLQALLGPDDPPVDGAALRELSGSPDQRFWVLQELETGLETAALAGPLVVGLDDLQWADAATLIAVSNLPRRLASHRILWIFAVRAGGLEPPVEQALHRIRQADPDILDLRHLDDRAVEEVSHDLLGGAPDPSLRELIAQSLGHPFLLVALIQGLLDERLVRVDSGVAQLVQARVPQRLLESVANQLSRLSPPTRAMLDMASILGRSFSLAELAALTEQPAAALLGAAREAIDIGLIVDRGERLAFRHDLVREAIDASIPVALKRHLQRRAMDVMLDQGAPPAEVASLVMAVAEPGELMGAELLARAAREIGQVSPSVAVPLIVRSLDLTPATDPSHTERFLAALALIVDAGQAAEAIRLLDGQGVSGQVDEPALAQARLSVVPLLMQYSATDAVRQCRETLALAGIADIARIHAYSLMANSLDVLGAPAEAADAVHAAVAAAAGRDDPALRVGILLPQAVVAYAAGDWREALRLAALAARLAAEGHEPHLWLVEAWRSLILIGLGQSDVAAPVIGAGSEQALRNGVMADVRIWSMVRCREFIARGALDDARAEAEAVLELSDEMATGVRDGYINHVARWVLADVASHTGDPDGLASARGWASRAVETGECRMSERMGAWMLARLQPPRGTERGARLDADLLDPLTVSLIRVTDPRRYSDAATLVGMLLAAGQREDAVAVVDRLRDAPSAAAGFPFLEAACVHAEAVLEADAALAREAAELYRDCPAPLVRALALEDAGRLAPPNKPEQAVGYLDAALKLYTDAGANRDGARVRGLLRRRGIRRPPPAGVGAPGWPELTGSEAAVVNLVADGATNREVAEQLYLSPHTVNAHLRHVFTKLGIRSRVELARLAADRDAGAHG